MRSQSCDSFSLISSRRPNLAVKLAEAQKSAEILDAAEREEYLDVEPATLIVAKNRAGPVGDVDLIFRKSCTRFETRDSRYARQFNQDNQEGSAPF